MDPVDYDKTYTEGNNKKVLEEDILKVADSLDLHNMLYYHKMDSFHNQDTEKNFEELLAVLVIQSETILQVYYDLGRDHIDIPCKVEDELDNEKVGSNSESLALKDEEEGTYTLGSLYLYLYYRHKDYLDQFLSSYLEKADAQFLLEKLDLVQVDLADYEEEEAYNKEVDIPMNNALDIHKDFFLYSLLFLYLLTPLIKIPFLMEALNHIEDHTWDRDKDSSKVEEAFLLNFLDIYNILD